MNEQETKLGALRKHLRFYGQDKDGLYYFARAGEDVINGYSVRDLANKNVLRRLAPELAWYSCFAYAEKPEEAAKISWDAATAWLIEEYRVSKYGIFDRGRLAGRGAWTDKGKLVVHLGNRLYVDGRFMELDTFRQAHPEAEHVYTRETEVIVENQAPLTVSECGVVLDFVGKFEWGSPLDRVLTTGWIGGALVCGAFDWRTHLWLAANPGTGKSTLLQGIYRLLQCFAFFFESAKTSEAAIRQSLGVDAKPVLFDEAEGSIQPVLDLVRSSSTDSGGTMAKGSANQKAINFKIRSMFLLASVVDSLKLEQDKQRFILVNLKRTHLIPEDANKRHLAVKLMIDGFTREFSGRLLMRNVGLAPIIKLNVEKFKKRLVSAANGDEYLADTREASQYAVPLACYWSLISDNEITESEIESMLREFKFFEEVSKKRSDTPREDSTGMELLDYLFKCMMDVPLEHGSTKMTVLEAMRYANSKWENDKREPCDKALRRYGMRVMTGGLFIENQNQLLSKLLEGASVNMNWNSVFKRIPGARSAVVTLLKSARGQVVPFNLKESGDDEAVIELPVAEQVELEW